MRQVRSALACMALLVGAIGIASPAAAAISFTGTTEEGGTGFGNVYDVLGLQARGTSTTEWGAVVWDGTDDVLLGDAINQSNTYLVADLIAGINPKPGLGADFEDWGLILNLNQQASDPVLLVTTFDLIVFDLAGTEAGRLSYVGPPLALDPADQGSGSSGFLFDISGLGALVAAAGGPSNARIGMEVPQNAPFGNANAGPESFYLGNFPGATPEPIPVIPEPASAVVWGPGMALFGAVRLRGRLLSARRST